MHFADFPIIIEDLSVAYQVKTVLWDIDLKIPGGLLCAVVGPNVAGKSTLLKSILGLVRPSAGGIKVFGESYDSQKVRVAYIPQRSSVDWDFPITVYDVVLMGTYARLGRLKRPGKREHAKARSALDQVNLAEFAYRPISRLSGGQAQRTFLARALAQDTNLFLQGACRA